MFKKAMLGMLAIGLIAASCEDDDSNGTPDNSVMAGVISGGPYSFEIDGVTDNVSEVAIDSEGSGEMSTFVITDEELTILGLPPTLDALLGVDFDPAGPGRCLIWYLSFNEGLEGAEMGMNAADLSGEFALSESIVVDRAYCTGAAELSGGPFEFTVMDGTPDMVSGVMADMADVTAANSGWIVTDSEGTILGLPGNIEMVNFDETAPGTCLIWYIAYEDGLEGLEMNASANDLVGCYGLSNAIEVIRN